MFDKKKQVGLVGRVALFIAGVAQVVAAAVDEKSPVFALTPENYQAATANKIVFIKFYAPWCGHCQELAPKWERLAEDYADQTTKYLIAEVDCTATPQVETWCEETFEVEGFPTLLFGDPGRGGALLEEYLDERDYETLAAFSAQMFATPLCNVDHMGGCSDEIKQQLIRYMSMTTEDIDAEIERIETEMDQVEEAFDESMDELQEQYDNMATDHQISVSAISKELKWMLEIKDSKITTS